MRASGKRSAWGSLACARCLAEHGLAVGDALSAPGAAVEVNRVVAEPAREDSRRSSGHPAFPAHIRRVDQDFVYAKDSGASTFTVKAVDRAGNTSESSKE